MTKLNRKNPLPVREGKTHSTKEDQQEREIFFEGRRREIEQQNRKKRTQRKTLV
jgi:hypothetical protein